MTRVRQPRPVAAWMLILFAAACAAGGCKTLSERYIALEVWKYERCFGHPPPGFVGGPVGGPMAPPMAPAMQPCNMPACQPANACDACSGAPLPAGMPAVVPGPSRMPVSSSRPVIISDEVIEP